VSIQNLDKIFQPKSLAVVGASERDGSVGAALMRNLIERGFSGDIFPINPNHNRTVVLGSPKKGHVRSQQLIDNY
jgi:acetyltransferase